MTAASVVRCTTSCHAPRRAPKFMSLRTRAHCGTSGIVASPAALPLIARERPPPRQQRTLPLASRRYRRAPRRPTGPVEQEQQCRQPDPQRDEHIVPPRERVALHRPPPKPPRWPHHPRGQLPCPPPGAVTALEASVAWPTRCRSSTTPPSSPPRGRSRGGKTKRLLHSPPMHRREGLAKLTGRERYLDDLPLGDFLWGATVRSPASRGRVTAVRFGKGVGWSQFVVVDAKDIPGPNEILLIEHDQPVLAAGYVRHVHEPVVLLAHGDRVALRRGVAAVTIEVAPEPAALDFRVPPRPDQIQYGADNVLKHLRIEKGDVERALQQAPVVVEGVYETGAQEHVYLEPQGMIAHLDGDVLVVRGSMQCPYYVLKAVMHALGRDDRRVRVVQAPTGGGFGGKEEYPSTIALHAALLALKSGRSVKLVYDRAEDMAATTKRHPARVRHRTGLTRDGKLLAQDIEVLMDGGAYVTLSPVVLSRGIIHAAGPYACEHVRIDGRRSEERRVGKECRVG